MTATEFQVSGMTCGHCEQSVREEVAGVAGVEQIEVSAATGRLVVHSTTPVADDTIEAAVRAAGYDAVRSAGAPTPPTTSASSCGCC
jgi:copper chaperone CopZ